MRNEAWLTGRKVDASKKIMATEILVFDIELFIGGRSQKIEMLTTLLSGRSKTILGAMLPSPHLGG